MKLEELDIVKNQSEVLEVDVSIINYDVNRFAVLVGKHSYTSLHSTLNAITTLFLKQNK